MKGKKTVSAICALKSMRPNDQIIRHSSSLDDILQEKGDMICLLRSKGMTKKEIAKKIRKSDRYVASVLSNYDGAVGLPKVMTKSARNRLLKARRAAMRADRKK